jgi:RNA polymerase sigma-70 factor (ECF subfamily)
MSERDDASRGLSASEARQVARIRSGDRTAFEELFRAHESLVYSVCLGIVGGPAIAQDLSQDLFCELWDRRDGLHPTVSLKAYLAGAARNKAISWARKKRPTESIDTWDASKRSGQAPRPIKPRGRETPQDALQHQDLQSALRQAVDELPRRRRLIYVMARQEHMTYAEIATALDISINTVKTQMGRALKFLRKRLKMFNFASQSN